MSIEQNKRFVEQFLAKFATADIDTVLADMSEACTGGSAENRNCFPWREPKPRQRWGTSSEIWFRP